MALQIKMNMAENGVHAPRTTGDMLLDGTVLDARDVAVFASMMKQKNGKVNDSIANFSAPSTAIFDVAQNAVVTQNTGLTQVTADTYCVDMASLFTMPQKADAKIADAKIADAKIADATIPDAKIADATIPDAKIVDATIPDENIADAKIADAKIADATIPDAKVADAKVADAKVADAKVVDAKSVDDFADFPSTVTLASSSIASPLANDATTLSNVSITPVNIAATPLNIATIFASEHGANDADTMYLVQDTAPNAQMAALIASMSGALQVSVMQNPVTPVVTEIKSVAAPHFTAKEIDAMVTMLVDRIAVTDVKAHMVTVEISLADTALRGTTVHLTRSLDGLLAVNVITNDTATFQTLVGAQIDLRTKLESLDSGMVRVDISHNPQEREREQNRRSAMYQEYVGDDDHA